MASLRMIQRRMASTAAGGRLFLGLDSSTQGLKATAIDEHMNVVHAFAVNYQKDLQYGTTNGVIAKPGSVVVQPTLMYLDALDLLLSQMKAKGFPFNRVASISGSGQQHGSAYWKTGARAALKGLKAGSSIKSQLAAAFRVPESPIWMDSSTSAQCKSLEAALGGPKAVAELTGSRAYERFTGNQIAKIAATQPDAYKDTERISLISSLMCSVLLGDYAPIDYSDGCGMNLLDLRSKKWAPSVLSAMAASSGATDLAAKLGEPAPSHAVVGTVAPYFTQSFGIPADATVVAWSGDNPCSVAGLGLRAPGDVAVSLGTSDTMFGILKVPSPGVEGHLFANPVDPASYMAMLCYKNGSLTRERVRNEAAGGSWDSFNAMLASTAPGNGGALGFYFDQPEITPTVHKAGVRRFAGGPSKRVASFDPAVEVRAVAESQFLSMRVHGEDVGIVKPTRLIATGGASGNPALTQVLADVFGAPVFVASQTDSASLGAAYRAAHGWVVRTRGAFVPFDTVLKLGAGAAQGGAVVPPGAPGPISLTLASSPRTEATAAYTAMLGSFKACEAAVTAEQ